MNEIQIFNNPEFGDIRTVMINDEPWFVGADVARALGYRKPTDAVNNNVAEDDSSRKGVTDNLGRTQQAIVINESGLYSLIFGSKLESAKKFKKWVTSEVLPSIRKTGSYNAPPMTIPEQIQLLAQGNVELNRRVNDMENEIESLKMDLPILPVEADRITEAVRKKGTAVLGGKQSDAYRNRSIQQKVYRNIYSNLKYNFGVKSYKSIKRRECEKAIEIINNYQPPFFLQQEIENNNAQQRLNL